MLLQYLFFVNFFYKQIYFYIGVMITPYLINKFLYKKPLITDIFLVNFASILNLLIAIPLLFLNLIVNNIYILCILNKLILFSLIIINKKNIRKFYNFYCQNWNRNFKAKNKIKSLTLRNLSIISFNLLLVVANIFLQMGS